MIGFAELGGWGESRIHALCGLGLCYLLCTLREPLGETMWMFFFFEKQLAHE